MSTINKPQSYVQTFLAFLVLFCLGAAADLPFHPNFKINYNLEPTSEEEVTIAAHGNHVVGGWHYCLEDDATSTTLARCAVGYSDDSGLTWHNAVMPLPAGFSDSCDPAVCCNAAGTFYYTQLGLNFDVSDETGVFFSRSTDFGHTWTAPVDVTGGTVPTGMDDSGSVLRMVDKEWVAADGNNVYISFGDLSVLIFFIFQIPISGDIRFVRSTDGGNTFGSVQTLNSSGLCNLSMPVADGTGNVYVFWRNFSDNKFYLARSTDSGASFSGQVEVAGCTDPDSPAFRVTTMPIVVVNKTNGHIYLAWMNKGAGTDPSDVLFSYSTDNGSHWSAPLTVNDDGAGHGQWFPWIDVDAGGTPHVLWYDERNNTGTLGQKLDVYYATFDAATGSFGTNERVTNTTFDVVLPTESDIVAFIGDYIGLAEGTRPYPAWMDSRSGNQDVFSSGHTSSLPARAQAMQVLDVSGSMGWESSVPGVDKIDALKEDAELFLNLLRDGGGGLPQDEMGLVQYSDDVVSFSAPGLPTVPYVPLTPIEATFRGQAQSYIQNMTSHNMTSIAQGLEKARDEFDAHGAADAAHMILLLSDGHETTGPYVDENSINELQGRNIRCFTLGYGTDPYIDEPLLSDIALKTGGNYYYVDSESPAVVTKHYIEALTSILDGFTVMDPIRQIRSNDPPQQEEANIVEADRTVTFILNWEHPMPDRLGLTLRTPDNREITPSLAARRPGIEFVSGKTYQFYRLHFPLGGAFAGAKEGKWQLVVRPGQLPAGQTENYGITTIADSGLRLDVAFDASSYGTDDKIILRAKLSQDGQPLAGGQVIDVVARSNIPLTGLGNFLSKNKLSPAEQEKMLSYRQKNPELSLKEAKLRVLLERNRKEDFFPRDEKTLILYDDGRHGDLAAGDGVYGNAFAALKTAGSYTFEVKAKLRSLAGHLATRQKVLSLYGKVNIDGGQSKVDVAAVDMARIGTGQAGYKVTVVPKDRLGNYLGPGFSSLIKLRATLGNFQPVQDNLDGSYSAVLVTDAKRKVRIAVQVDGVTFAHRPVASPEGPPARSGASLHLGLAFPLEAFGQERKAGFNVLADFEYLLRPQLSLRAYIGYNRFPAGSSLTDDASIININTNLRYSRQVGGFSIFGEAGPGYYSIDNSSSRVGLNVGCGIWHPLSTRWGVELAAHYHSIFTSPDRTVYFHLAGGFTLRL